VNNGFLGIVEANTTAIIADTVQVIIIVNLLNGDKEVNKWALKDTQYKRKL
jgi:hypothetical protein